MWFPRGKGGKGGKGWEFGISKCKLLYIGWINKKVSLCSTGNYIQYPVMNHNRKEYEKIYVELPILIKKNRCYDALILKTSVCMLGQGGF